MLVLTRKRYESVVLAEEITVTVEEIIDSDGERLSGTRVRLGFQCPRHIPIERSECRRRNSKALRWNDNTALAAPRPGVLSEVSGAQVRLRIRVPRKVPVYLNGTPTVGLKSEVGLGDDSAGATAVYRITCHQEDVVTICRNISVATVAFLRFIPSDSAVAAAS